MRRDGVHRDIDRHLGLGQFVLHHQLVGEAGAGTTIGLGHLGQQKAHLAERTPDLARDVALAAPFVEPGSKFGGNVAAHLLAKGVDLAVHPGVAIQLWQHMRVSLYVGF